MFIQKRKTRVVADTDVAPEATELLFEAEDVAELVAEVTGQPVEVQADENTAEFTIGEEVYTVEAEGDEEVLEASTRVLKSRKPISASTQRAKSSKTVRRIPRK